MQGRNVLTGKVANYLTKLFPLRLNCKTWPLLMMLKIYFVHTLLFAFLSLPLSFLKQLSFLEVALCLYGNKVKMSSLVTTIQRFKTSVSVPFCHFT